MGESLGAVLIFGGNERGDNGNDSKGKKKEPPKWKRQKKGHKKISQISRKVE